MDSKLISIVREVENEAERILQQAGDQASAMKSESQATSARLTEEKKSAANSEAEDLLRQARANTQQELERGRAREKEALAALLRRAEARIGKAEKMILDELGKL